MSQNILWFLEQFLTFLLLGAFGMQMIWLLQMEHLVKNSCFLFVKMKNQFEPVLSLSIKN